MSKSSSTEFYLPVFSRDGYYDSFARIEERKTELP